MKTHTKNNRPSIAGARFTTLWGWFTAPRFGAAGSGGLEYEPFPRKTEQRAA